MRVALLAAFLFLAGTLTACYGMAIRRRAKTEALRKILDVELADPSVSPEALSDLMERAGAFAEKALSRTTWGGRVRSQLLQAGWSLKAGEFAALAGAGCLTAGALVFSLTGSATGAVLAGLAVVAGSGFTLARKARGRLRCLEQELPATLQSLATALDSGASVLDALRLLAEEGPPPLSSELSRVVAETAVGRSVGDALEAMAARVGSRDIDWTVEAIRIQIETGGKLADTLRVLADFMRSRQEVRGEVRALSAEARLSAKVLSALPLFVGGYLYLFRRSYLQPLFESGAGKTMLVLAAAGICIGSLWMRRLVKVEI